MDIYLILIVLAIFCLAQVFLFCYPNYYCPEQPHLRTSQHGVVVSNLPFGGERLLLEDHTEIWTVLGQRESSKGCSRSRRISGCFSGQ